MKRIQLKAIFSGVSTLLLVAFAFLQLSFAKAQPDNTWELAKETDGIQVYLRERDDSPIKEFRAVGQVKASLSSIVALLIDAEAAPNWYNHVKEGRLLAQPSANSHIAYTALSFPWPFADRDMISKFNYTQDESGTVRMEVQSLPHQIPEDEKMIRISKVEGYWLLTPIEEGRVEVQYQFFADPEGTIPGWLINLFLVEDPIAAMKNLQVFVQKPKYQQAEVAFLK